MRAVRRPEINMGKTSIIKAGKVSFSLSPQFVRKEVVVSGIRVLYASIFLALVYWQGLSVGVGIVLYPSP